MTEPPNLRAELRKIVVLLDLANEIRLLKLPEPVEVRTMDRLYENASEIEAEAWRIFSNLRLELLLRNEWPKWPAEGGAETPKDRGGSAMMTRKDFTKLAASIAKRENADERRLIAVTMAEFLAENNPRFNQGQFLQACNLEEASRCQ